MLKTSTHSMDPEGLKETSGSNFTTVFHLVTIRDKGSSLISLQHYIYVKGDGLFYILGESHFPDILIGESGGNFMPVFHQFETMVYQLETRVPQYIHCSVCTHLCHGVTCFISKERAIFHVFAGESWGNFVPIFHQLQTKVHQYIHCNVSIHLC